jgi:hypothetical protein
VIPFVMKAATTTPGSAANAAPDLPFDLTEGSVTEHKFRVGQAVNYMSGPYGRGGASCVYEVMQLLPPEGDDHQYRIKSADEPHERVVKESQLIGVG